MLRHTGGAGIYTERGNSLDVSYSEIHDNGTGVFLNSVLSSSITYTTIYNIVTCGILHIGNYLADLGIATTSVVDHVTLYKITGQGTAHWNGYGISFDNAADSLCSVTITNSIIANPPFGPVIAGMAAINLGASWPTTYNNNFYGTMANFGDPGFFVAIDGGLPDSLTDIVGTDAGFTDAENDDYSLAWGSPCADKASDGTHIGAWQGTVGINDCR